MRLRIKCQATCSPLTHLVGYRALGPVLLSFMVALVRFAGMAQSAPAD